MAEERFQPISPVECKLSVDVNQLACDVLWQLAKGALNAVVAAQGARTKGGAFSEVESKYEKLGSLVTDFVEEVEHLELNL